MQFLHDTRFIASVYSELLLAAGVQSIPIAAKAILASAQGINIERFFLQRIFDSPRRTWSEYMQYYGELEPGLRTLNWQGEAKRLTLDKLSTAERLVKHNIPTAPIIMCVGRDVESFATDGLFPTLSCPSAIGSLLARYSDDLFVKPSVGWRGQQIFTLARRDSSWAIEHCFLSEEEAAALLLDRAPSSGLLVQKRLRTHPDLSAIGGDFGLCTLRINTALTSTGSTIVFVFLKLMGAPSLTDNFTEGSAGNFIAQVNVTSGMVERAFGRLPGNRVFVQEFRRHPKTGTEFKGVRLPFWNETIALALATSRAFPEAPLVGMDVAITPEGPMVIELQPDWGCTGAQLVSGGLRPRLRALLPQLVTSEEARQLAYEQMRLNMTRFKPPATSSVPLDRADA